MSMPTRWSLVYVLFVAACASGGSAGGGGGDDVGDPIDAAVTTHYDSSVSMLPDAGVKMDGSVVVQDAVVQQPDAGSGLFCTSNAQCTNSGECCLTLGGSMGFCAPGTIVLGQCFPIN